MSRTLSDWQAENAAFCELAAFDPTYYRQTPAAQAVTYATFVREHGRKPGQTTVLRHEPYDDCDGRPVAVVLGVRNDVVCRECGAHLCPCEQNYGHDCE